ncbi:cellulose binding domain-containing protein [Glycomyces algeriensis]|uniref:CBM2 domain-containing protein n=1 Tax=Glycomyces algeriensis TaxID=256037 RepID=A0A9W6GD79_9ACTN|nr:cellulose binding domain-containing protein [Glycomyces algeriensis]MDA1368249.1 cellulose binding domain-containing protein [Glycomyces algeriensis]MDR7351889.1 cytoskeletal protein RodZ [Glycomyces algeriensis]GLI44619.1 hypothetical protein GALLR39Z86_44690 [Glycomyces algeriensis]
MSSWMNRAVRRGRIHGRLMLVLVAVVVLASAAAIWQFSTLRDGHDPDLARFDDEETTTESSAAAAETPASSAPAPASPTVSASPTEAASSSAAPSAPAPTTEAVVSGPQCTATLTLDNEWGESVSVTVTVAGTGTEPVDGWEVLIGIEHLSVTATWGITHIEGERYGDILFNAAIDPGDSVDASFQADVQGDYEIPATVPCTPV